MRNRAQLRRPVVKFIRLQENRLTPDRTPAAAFNTKQGRLGMRHFIVVVTLEAGHSVSGCIYVPPVWGIGDAINEVDQIKERTTTKEEALNLLGEPDWGQEEKRAVFLPRRMERQVRSAVGMAGGNELGSDPRLIRIRPRSR